MKIWFRTYFVSVILLLSIKDANGQTGVWDNAGGTATSVETSTTGDLVIKSGYINLETSSGDIPRNIIAKSTSSGLGILSGHNGADGAHITLNALGHPTHPGYMGLHTVGTGNFGFWNINGATTTPLVTISLSGLYVRQGLIDLQTHGSDLPRNIVANSTTSSLGLLSGHNGSDGAYIGLNAIAHPTHPGYMGLHTVGAGGFGFWNITGATSTPLLKINMSGVFVQQGQIHLETVGGDFPRKINANTTNSSLTISSNSNSTNGSTIEMYGSTYPDNPGGDRRAGRIHYNTYGNSGYGHLFQNYDPAIGGWYSNLGIRNDGKVVIGKNLINNGTTLSTAPDGYLLYVQKGILTEKIKVANAGDGLNWSDFVFDDDYKLMSLENVEHFIKSNKHLPEIPSATEVANEGIDVAEMDAKLLQKIEELTLYVIQQQKQLQHQQKEIEKLKKSRN